MQRVGIICKPLADFGARVQTLLEWIRAQGKELLLDEAAASILPDIPTAPRQRVLTDCDLILVLGGDGTLLAAAREAAGGRAPVFGVNLGSLGFLTGTPLDAAQATLARIFAGEIRTEDRALLTARLERDGTTLGEYDCLNDAVINKGAMARIVSLDVKVNGRPLTRFRADGLILATPTGSTAYCMAAGGPIVTPGLPCITLVPICPHTLTNRPLVLSTDAVIEITIVADHQDLYLTLDGQQGMALETGDRIHVSRSPKRVQIIHDLAYDYFSVLRAKLGWGR
ncbi:MAG: NAD(+)/NADH kinase [Nitrospirota bacterium]|jgi:NAD+ kinase